MALDTGHGAVIAFTSGTFSAVVTSIEPGAKSREALDASHLATSGDAEMIPGDLWRHDVWTVNYLVDPTAAAKTEPPTGVDTLTITLPNQGSAGAANYAGTGFVTTIQPPSLATDTIMAGSFGWQFDGYTGPTFTHDSTA